MLRPLGLMTVHLISQKLETPITIEPIRIPNKWLIKKLHNIQINNAQKPSDHSLEYNEQTESMTLNPKPATSGKYLHLQFLLDKQNQTPSTKHQQCTSTVAKCDSLIGLQKLLVHHHFHKISLDKQKSKFRDTMHAKTRKT